MVDPDEGYWICVKCLNINSDREHECLECDWTKAENDEVKPDYDWVKRRVVRRTACKHLLPLDERCPECSEEARQQTESTLKAWIEESAKDRKIKELEALVDDLKWELQRLKLLERL